jgi:hypothetical protein
LFSAVSSGAGSAAQTTLVLAAAPYVASAALRSVVKAQMSGKNHQHGAISFGDNRTGTNKKSSVPSAWPRERSLLQVE